MILNRIFFYIIQLLLVYLAAQFIHVVYQIPLLSTLSLCFSLYLLLDLLRNFKQKLPLIEFTSAIYGLQLLLCPYLEYHLFHNKIYGVMQVDELEYFSYLLPGVFFFYLGLKLFSTQKKYQSIQEIESKILSNPGYYFNFGMLQIAIGYFFYILSLAHIGFGLTFVIHVLSNLRFIGFFYIWFAGTKRLWIYFLIVFLPYFIQVFNATVFIDLIVWVFFLFAFYFLKHRTQLYKIALVGFIGFLSVFFLQSAKMAYRQYVWQGKTEGTIENLSLFGNIISTLASRTDANTSLILGSNFNIRLNQGWIVTDILKNLNKPGEYVGWKYLKPEFIGILLPRILYPQKLDVGDDAKFNEFVGWEISSRTSMDLSIMGDAYGAFGRRGGIIFCFIIGALFGFIYRSWNSRITKYPDLIFWLPLIFFYMMRAGNEFYIVTNWIIKVSLLTLVFHFFLLKVMRYFPSRVKPKVIG